MAEEERLYWLGLHTTSGVGNRRTIALVEHFGSARQAWRADEVQLQASGILTGAARQNILARREQTDLAALAASWRRRGIEFCTLRDAVYPPPLTAIYDPPAVLYYRGRLPAWDKAIAVVGTRRCSTAGRRTAIKLAADLAAAAVVVVSGAARGIDTAAHQGALTAGATVAVLGCGVDVAYPPENRALLQEITRSGAVLSEFPPGTRPAPGQFPVRNRIISGLCRGVLVVEAAEKSGALITADCALEQGRDVFAVPGGVFADRSRGANNLIKQGAKLVDSAADILDEYGWRATAAPAAAPVLSPDERLVYDAVRADVAVTLDDIAAQTSLPVSRAACVLLQLELQGLVQQQPGQQYLRLAGEVK